MEYCFFRKRAKTKQLIEAYYSQLTDGCGDNVCGNPNCASCPDFTYKDKDKNVLALTSINLFKEKAQLCHTERNKMARLPDGVSPMGSSRGSSPMVSPVSSSVPLPGPSGSKSSTGATPKSLACTPTG